MLYLNVRRWIYSLFYFIRIDELWHERLDSCICCCSYTIAVVQVLLKSALCIMTLFLWFVCHPANGQKPALVLECLKKYAVLPKCWWLCFVMSSIGGLMWYIIVFARYYFARCVWSFWLSLRSLIDQAMMHKNIHVRCRWHKSRLGAPDNSYDVILLKLMNHQIVVMYCVH